MPIVGREADIAPNTGKRVRIEGTLERVPVIKHTASHPGTALRLDDGTLVWITYSEPPPGWEVFVGQKIAVEAVIWPGPPPGSLQALVAPHATDWGTPSRL